MMILGALTMPDLASPPASLLSDPERLPLRPPRAVEAFGRTLVVAPHPDDESLGCGGALGLLARYGLDVRVLVMSDGTGSHPNSQAWPPPRLAALREREIREALAALGLSRADVRFLRLEDTHVPSPDCPGFEDAVARCQDEFEAFRPETLLLPWRRDPHGDHRASWQIADAALEAADLRPRRIEYPVWIWAYPDSDDAPRPGEVTAWRLDVRDALAQKQAAIAAHRSQTTALIDDDPDGFRLLPGMLAHFARPWELFLELA